MKSISVFYFSGTGGTELAAYSLAESLKKLSIEVFIIPLSKPLKPNPFPNGSEPETRRFEKPGPDELKKAADEAEELIIFFPVYASDTPWPIYEWIETLDGRGRKTGVVSVSGGGDIWPNPLCRERSCRKLEKRGFNVCWGKMLVMPPNVITEGNKDLMIRLIRILPEISVCRNSKRSLKAENRRPWRSAPGALPGKV